VLDSFTRASTWKDRPLERKGEGPLVLETEGKETCGEKAVLGVYLYSVELWASKWDWRVGKEIEEMKGCAGGECEPVRKAGLKGNGSGTEEQGSGCQQNLCYQPQC